MTLGIDATNIRGGGGHHHLMELLLHADPVDHGFQRVIVWGGEKTLAELPDKYWLTKINNGTDARNFFGRTLWQIRHLGKAAQHKNCNMLFIPGGSYLRSFPARHLHEPECPSVRVQRDKAIWFKRYNSQILVIKGHPIPFYEKIFWCHFSHRIYS